MAYRLIFCLFFLPVMLFGQRIDVQKITVRENIVLRGRSIDSFSVDGTFNSPSNLEIPTQKAIYDYISGITAGLAYLPIQGGTLTGTAGAGFLGLPPQASAPSAPATGVSVYADASGRVTWIRPDGYTRTIDASTITANRVFTLQDKSYTLADNTDVTALQSTVAGLVSTYFPLLGGSITGTGGSGFVGFISQSSSPSTPGSGFRMYSDATGRLAWKGTNGFVRVFDGMANTADRAYVLPDASGTFNLIDVAQTITAIKTFAPTGSGASGFIYSSTTRPSHPFGTVTTAQRDAMTGMAAGDGVYNATTKRINLWDVSWLSIPTMASGGLGNGQVARGDASGNIFSDANLVYTLAATHNLSFGTFGTSFSLSFPNSQSGFARSIVASNAGNAFVFSIASSLLTLDQNGAGITTAQGGTFMRLEAGSHYGDFMKIRSYSGNGYGGGFTGIGTTSPQAHFHVAPAYTYTGDISGVGYFFRVSTGNVINNTTASSGTVTNGALSSFDGGTLAPIGSNVTYTNLSTVSILAAPIAGGSSIITNPWALRVVAGNASFGGSIAIGGNTPVSSALVEMTSTAKGLLIPRGTDANIAAVASPALLLMMGSTTSERINVKRTDGFYQIAYTQDVKRDSTYKTVNANLDLSALTATFKTRFHTVRIKTVVTAAATGNNTITMPVPTVDLLGISFKVSTEDTSGDGDISVLSFGTDGADGYLYNGDNTFGTSLNLFPGLGVYLSVAWCEAKSAYRWELQ